MPFKSKAQQRWMFAAANRGEIPKDMPRRWAHHTKSIKKLPEHVSDKSGGLSPAGRARLKLAVAMLRIGQRNQNAGLVKAARLVARGRSLAVALSQSFPEKTAERLFQVAEGLVHRALRKAATATPSTPLPPPAKPMVQQLPPKAMAQPPLAKQIKPIPVVA